MKDKPASRISLSQTFAALQYPNYRLWFWGQMVSLFGTWMQSTAQSFLVFELTHSAAFLGYVGFASGIPIWLFMLFGGVVADRIPRRTLLIITQSYMMGLAFVLAALTFAHLVKPWHIVVLAFCLGAGNAFDAPARQAFLLEMVDRKVLTNAIALNSAMFNAATAVGPAVAGMAYAFFGPSWCFTINGASFLAVIAALLLMKLKPSVMNRQGSSAFSDLKEGLSYVATHPSIRVLVALVAVTSLFGLSFATLIPAWAVRVLRGDATTNGLLQSARGVGALASSLMIASLGRFKIKGKLLTAGSIVFPAMLLAFAFVRLLPFSLLILVGAGAALILIFNLANALVQTLSPDTLRGRVMSIYSLTFFGLLPIGSLLAGAVAERTGEPNTVVLGSLVTLGFALLIFLLFPRVRQLR